MQRRSNNARLYIAEASLPVRLFQHARRPKTEWSGLSGQWGGQLCAAANDGDGQREELIVLSGGIDDSGHPATWLQRSAHTAERLLLIREVNQADARDYSVECFRLDLKILAVQHPRFHHAQPGSACIASSKLENIRGDISGQDISSWTNAPGSGQRLTACARSHVENATIGAHACQVEHGLCGRAEPLLDERSPTIPGSSRRLPLVARGFLVVNGIKRRSHWSITYPFLFCVLCFQEHVAHPSHDWRILATHMPSSVHPNLQSSMGVSVRVPHWAQEPSYTHTSA